MFVIDIAHKARFFLFANAFISQLCNFTCIQKDDISVVYLAMYKPKLKNI